MSKDLLLRIQELNRRNHLLTGADPATGTAGPAAVGSIDDLEERILQAVRERVGRVLDGFTSQLAALDTAPQPAPTLQPEQPEEDLEDTQWIRRGPDALEAQAPTQVLRSADPGLPRQTPADGSREQEVLDSLLHIENKLNRLEQHLDGDGAPAAHVAPDRDDLVRDLAERLEAGLSEVRVRIDELPASVAAAAPASADQPPLADRLDEIERSLHAQLQELAGQSGGEGTDTDQLLERIATLQASLEERLQGAFETPDAASSDQAETLDQKLGDRVAALTESLGQDMRQQLQELIQSVAGIEGGASVTSDVDLEPVYERIDGLAEVVQRRTGEVLVRLESLLEPADESGAAAQTPAAAATGADSCAVDEALTLVKGLRKDLSLLVHTMNNHLEENSQILEAVSAIRSRVEGGEDGAAPSVAPGDDSVQKMLADLDELKLLPERIAGLLTSTDQAHQEVIRNVITQQADTIVERLSRLTD